MRALNVIYGLTDPRNGQLRYVGKSTSGVTQRLRSHLCPSSLRPQTRKNGWLKGLLTQGLRPEAFVIEECASKAALNEAERHQIASLRAIGCDLTNGTPGGDGQGLPCSPETRAKISAATKGRRHTVLSSEAYRLIALKARGRKRSLEANAKTAAGLRGRKHTPEAIAKMSAARREYYANKKEARP